MTLEEVLQNRAIFKERRPAQEQMMQAIWDGLRSQDSHHLTVVEAGTGTGKSLAEIVPILVNLKNPSAYKQGRAVIATASKNLQTQLVEKDLKFLRKHFDFTYSLAKGRNNYLCLRKVDKAREKYERGHRELKDDIEFIESWETKTGDFANLPEKFQSSYKYSCENCTGRSCTYYGNDLEPCFYLQAAAGRGTDNIIVTNHHRLCYDLLIHGRKIFNGVDIVVIDEAHKFEETARAVLTTEFTQSKFPKLLKKIGEEVRSVSWGAQESRAKRVNEEFFTELASMYEETGKVFLKEVPDSSNFIRIIGDLQFFLKENMRPYGQFPEIEDLSNEEAVLKYQFLEQLVEIQAILSHFSGEKHAKFVYCVESYFARGERRAKLIAEPISVVNYLQGGIFNVVPRVVMTSATMSEDGKNFDLLRTMTGAVPNHAEVLPPVFDFKKQSLLYVPRGIVMPARIRGQSKEKYDERYAEYQEDMIEEIQDLIACSDGGCFVLTTSYKDLKAIKAGLTGEWPVFAQGDLEPKLMLKKFEEHGNAVLVGTKSFWEGVDVPGDALRLVIITRTPFTSPMDPWYIAIDALPQHEGGFGGRAFWKYAKPKAFQDMRQAFGRLIRTLDDKGVVAMLDSRVHTKSYGKELIAALPDARYTEELTDVEDFYDSYDS